MTFGTSWRVLRIGHERQHDHAERRLHRRVLVQLVEHHARNRVALELDDDARRVAIDSSRRSLMPSSFLSRTSSAMSFTSFARLTWYGSSVTTICDLFDDLLLLDHRARAHDDLAASRLLIVLDAGAAVDVAARREVRALHQLARSRRSSVSGLSISAIVARDDFAAGCAAGCSSPCRPRCPTSR